MFRSENEMTAELDNYFDQNSCQELDDLKILVRFFKDFDQNSGGQMTMKFFRRFNKMLQ